MDFPPPVSALGDDRRWHTRAHSREVERGGVSGGGGGGSRTCACVREKEQERERERERGVRPARLRAGGPSGGVGLA